MRHISDREKLEQVEEKIEKLKAKLLELKKKKKREGLSPDEEVELEEFDEELRKLEADKKYWQRIIEKATGNAQGQAFEMSGELMVIDNEFQSPKPAFEKQWSGNDLDSNIVQTEIAHLFKKHSESLSNVSTIEFAKFKDTDIALNPVDKESPSILLTGLDSPAEQVIMEPNQVNCNCDILLLLATSGMGKTRAIFQYLSKNFGLYFIPSKESCDNEMKFHFGPRDFLGIENKLKQFADNDPTTNLEIINRYIKCLVLARLLILEKVIENSNVTPLNWLVFQLKNSTETSIFTEMVKIVKNFLEGDLEVELARIRVSLKDKVKGHRLACVFDEAQYLLKLGVGKFQSRDSNEKRPLYSAIVNSILNVFGGRDNHEFDTMFWASGTGLSIAESKKLTFSQVGRFPDQVLNVTFHTINNILSDGEDVYNYVKQFLPNNVDEIDEFYLDVFVGRRRFSATMVEQILLRSRNTTIQESVNITKQRLIDQLKKSWNSINGRTSPNYTAAELIKLFDLSKKLIRAYVFSGRPLLINSNDSTQQKELIYLFEFGIGIIESLNDSDNGPWIRLSLKEPLVMISGDSIFEVSKDLFQCDPHTPISSLGFMWEHCIARALVDHSLRNGGYIDISEAFGIDKSKLNESGIESRLLLTNCQNPTIFEKRSIDSFLSNETQVPIVSPSTLAGPDGVCKLGGFPTFIQMKFRKNFGVGEALMTLTPSQFYMNKNGFVPERFKRKLDFIQSNIGETVIRILICYPVIVKSNIWKDHFRNFQSRNTRNKKVPLKYIDLLVDGRNANAFFGDRLVKLFDQVREQAAIFTIEADILKESDEKMDTE